MCGLQRGYGGDGCELASTLCKYNVRITLVCHQKNIVKNYMGSMHVGGYGRLRESGLCVFRKLCPVGLLVVGKSSSVLLHLSVVMPYIGCGDDG